VHQAVRLVNDLLMEPASHSLLRPAGAPVSFKRRLGSAHPPSPVVVPYLHPEGIIGKWEPISDSPCGAVDN
jgi:hypothetical protein